ncbi:MAG TPA: DNA-3-methyladenine glycosylase I [Candidatus Eisenbergiella merdipullorum]|uniref:DNA-3-methyladenine glycosylase I n=1 Tax=Candidatus Eisenbergiella merdipullorum TaxID=2838553 RepID=A0A9D2IAA0_9FIRM|nr:DNA-3-methyladenine glycosylase I [Candidatus Eisenbergiella merdipullorum]
MNREITRCAWCCDNGVNQNYHDEEWGVPLHDDRMQFEYLSLEVLQCGLNWTMMLNKREIFRQCFDDFDFDKVAFYDEKRMHKILETPGMIRSPRKVNAIINNAACFRKIRAEYGSFDVWLWGFTGGKTHIYRKHQQGESESKNELSDRIAAELKKRGFKYLGSVTVYSHLQACGIINDHSPDCFRYRELLDMADVEFD